MSKTTVLVFNGGSIGGDNSVDAHNLQLEVMQVNLTESSTSSVYVLVDKSLPIEDQPHYAPVDRYEMSKWLQQGDVVQIDCSNLVPTVDDSYSGVLQNAKDTTDSQSKPYTSTCTIRVDVKTDQQIESRFYDLEAVQDIVTGIWYLACSINTYAVIKYPVTKGIVHRISTYTDDIQGAIVEIVVDYDRFDPDHPLDSEIDKQTLNTWIANREPVLLAIKFPGYDAIGWALLDQAFLFEDGTSNMTFFLRNLSPRNAFRIYNLYTVADSNRVAIGPFSDMTYQTVGNMLSFVNMRDDRYPSCLAVKNAIAEAHNLGVHFENSNVIDAQNHSHYTIRCTYPSLVIRITTENGKAPAEFAAEIYCETGHCTVSVLINGMVAYPSVAGGTEMEEGKFYQLTCVGSCWTLAEFTPSDQVYIGGTAYTCVHVGTKLWLAQNLDYAWPELTVGDNDISYSRQLANYYNNDSATHGTAGDKYGLLYNFAAAEYLQMHKDTLLPPGWRLPTTEEIEELAQSVGGLSVAGRDLKSPDGWTSGTGLGSYEINIVPGGSYDGSFSNLGSQGILWTASADGITYSCDTSDAMTMDSTDKITGCSIRLVKDLL